MSLQLPSRPTWYDEAACRGMGPDLFYMERGVTKHDHRAIRTVCSNCPVKTECLKAGIGDHFGVWGGVTPKDRRPGRLRLISTVVTGEETQ
jgi:hypothetical protein